MDAKVLASIQDAGGIVPRARDFGNTVTATTGNMGAPIVRFTDIAGDDWIVFSANGELRKQRLNQPWEHSIDSHQRKVAIGPNGETAIIYGDVRLGEGWSFES